MSDKAELQQAFQLHGQGRLMEAARLYENLIRKNKNNHDALHFLGVIKAGFGLHAEARALMERSLAAKAPNLGYAENYVTLLAQLGEYELAAKTCARTITAAKRTETLSYVRGYCLYRLEHFEEAIKEFTSLLALSPDHLAGNNEMAAALGQLRRFKEALPYVEKVLAASPASAPTLLNKANILLRLHRPDEAIATYQRAISLDASLYDAYLGLAGAYSETTRYDDAFKSLDKAAALRPDLAGVWLGRGNVFLNLKQHDEARSAYDKALALSPTLAEAWLGHGNLLLELGGRDDALVAYDKALSLDSSLAQAWYGRAEVFSRLRSYDDAVVAYDRAFALQPDLELLQGRRLHFKMRICDWHNFTSERDQLLVAARSGVLSSDPLSLVALSSSPDDQLRFARAWVGKKYPVSKAPMWRGEAYRHEKVRVAYASSDFREHPVALLAAELFEHHDRSRFEITAISFGRDDGSAIRRRLQAAFNEFLDVNQLSDEEVAERIRRSEIDILIDLNGFTENARFAVFGRRPAPVQASYLGYPGTLGADAVDYLIADPLVVPQADSAFYSEKIVRLPHTYQPNDTKRIIAERTCTRTELGLPEDGFVFCCFNNNFKILPEVFDGWMRILKRVEGSVLWLREDNATAASNLRREATRRGVSPERLVFARRMPMADHLARHRAADLFLDTLPYNAHTTASDALWAGLPVLTQIGQTFSGRVAASLLNAVGMPELIMATAAQYEERAVELAGNPGMLAEARAKLARNRLTSPLFKPELLARHLEKAFEAMHERHCKGLPPDHIDVQP